MAEDRRRKAPAAPFAEMAAIAEALAVIGDQAALERLLDERLKLKSLTDADVIDYFEAPCRAPKEGEPPFAFMMGSLPEETGHQSNENLVRAIVARELWVMPTSVTVAQWSLMTGERIELQDERARFPKVDICWFEARLFCHWLNMQRRRQPGVWKARLGDLPSDLEFTLPNEVQREFFTRAGTTTRFWKGDSDTDLEEVDWFSENSGPKLHPVAQKPANPWGLYDVHGNVWEWCSNWSEDRLRADMGERPAERGRFRAVRGGCFRYDADGCRSASRDGSWPDYAGGLLGFRLVLSPQLVGNRTSMLENVGLSGHAVTRDRA